MPRSGRFQAWVPVLSALRQLTSATLHAVGVTVRPGKLPPPPEGSGPAAMPPETDSGPPSEWLDYLRGRDPVWLTGQPTPSGDPAAEDEPRRLGPDTGRPPRAPEGQVQPPKVHARLLPAGRARLLPPTPGPGPVADPGDGVPRAAIPRPAAHVVSEATEPPGPAGWLSPAQQLPPDRPFLSEARPAPLSPARSTPGERRARLLPAAIDVARPAPHGTDPTEPSRWHTTALPENPGAAQLTTGGTRLPMPTNPAAPSSATTAFAAQLPIDRPGAIGREVAARHDRRPNSTMFPEKRVIPMPLRNRAGAVARTDPPVGGVDPTSLRWAPLPDTEPSHTALSHTELSDTGRAETAGTAGWRAGYPPIPQVNQIWQRLGNGPGGDRLVAAQRSR